MAFKKELEKLMEEVEQFIAPDLLDQLETVINLTFEEGQGLNIIRTRMLEELNKYVAPLVMEKVSLSIRKFIHTIKVIDQELMELNNIEEDSSEEEEETLPKELSPKEILKD